MTVLKDTEAEIRRLFFAEHWKRGTVAAQLGVHPDVVARVLGTFGPKPGTPRPEARLIEPYLSFIGETLDRYPRLVATRIYDMLRERGYTGSIGTVRKHVRHVRPKRTKPEAVLRIETLPGEQAQVDWAHIGDIAVPGGRRALWAFVMVLAYSRAAFAELVVSLDIHSLRRSLVRAGVAFGGLPRQWLFDNAKTVVIERRGDAIRFHDDLLDLAGRLHVQPRVCAPHRPQEKGGVERAIRFFKERFFAARTFHSVEHGTAKLAEFIAEIAHPRPHPRYPDRTVANVFAEERLRLLPLPDPLPSTDLVAPIPVDRAGFVRLDTNRYSVPHTHAGGTLTLVADDVDLRLLDGDREVARHARSWGRNQWLELPEHRAALVKEKRAARELKGRDRLRVEVPEIEPLFERWILAGRNLGSMVARTLGLLDAYGAPVLRDAVADMLARDIHDPGAMAILCEQRRRRRGDKPSLIVALGAHVQDRDVIPHDLGGYDE
ncbi:MAG: IS21 family transposase [Gemmatimonadetes bacterium]|nr:IS21 family transposase [Gemmatimonadota bacterium]